MQTRWQVLGMAEGFKAIHNLPSISKNQINAFLKYVLALGLCLVSKDLLILGNAVHKPLNFFYSDSRENLCPCINLFFQNVQNTPVFLFINKSLQKISFRWYYQTNMKTNFFKLKISSYLDNVEVASNHIGENLFDLIFGLTILMNE